MKSFCMPEDRSDAAYEDARQREVDAQFTVAWSYEKPGAPVSLDSLLDANREAEDLCTWLRNADVGEESRWGGGAAPLCVIRRVR